MPWTLFFVHFVYITRCVFFSHIVSRVSFIKITNSFTNNGTLLLTVVGVSERQNKKKTLKLTCANLLIISCTKRRGIPFYGPFSYSDAPANTLFSWLKGPMKVFFFTFRYFAYKLLETFFDNFLIRAPIPFRGMKQLHNPLSVKWFNVHFVQNDFKVSLATSSRFVFRKVLLKMYIWRWIQFHVLPLAMFDWISIRQICICVRIYSEENVKIKSVDKMSLNAGILKLFSENIAFFSIWFNIYYVLLKLFFIQFVLIHTEGKQSFVKL